MLVLANDLLFIWLIASWWYCRKAASDAETLAILVILDKLSQYPQYFTTTREFAKIKSSEVAKKACLITKEGKKTCPEKPVTKIFERELDSEHKKAATRHVKRGENKIEAEISELADQIKGPKFDQHAL